MEFTQKYGYIFGHNFFPQGYPETKLAVWVQNVEPVDLAPKSGGVLDGLCLKKAKNCKTCFLAKITFSPNNLLRSRTVVKIWNFSSRNPP